MLFIQDSMFLAKFIQKMPIQHKDQYMFFIPPQNYRLLFFTNIDTDIFKKIFKNQIQQCRK